MTYNNNVNKSFLPMLLTGYILIFLGQVYVSLAASPLNTIHTESSSSSILFRRKSRTDHGVSSSWWWRRSPTNKKSNSDPSRATKTATPLHGTHRPRSVGSGTRTTGAGSRSIRNQSIFLDPTSNHTLFQQCRNPYMYAKIDEDGHLLLQFTTTRTAFHSMKESTPRDRLIIQLSHGGATTVNERIGGDGESETMNMKTRNQTFIHIQQYHPSTTSSSVSINDFQRWLPIQGIYGFFLLPSGWHIALITESEFIYTYPTTTSTTTTLQPNVTDSTTWSFPIHNSIYRIKSIEIVPLLSSSSLSLPTTIQKEEERQLRLLRKAFREHDLYFMFPPHIQKNTIDEINNILISDMTNTLQRCFLHWMKKNKGKIPEQDNQVPNLSSYIHIPLDCSYDNYTYYDSILFNYTVLLSVTPCTTDKLLNDPRDANKSVFFQPIHHQLYTILPMALKASDDLITHDTFLLSWNHHLSNMNSIHTKNSSSYFTTNNNNNNNPWGENLDSRFFWNEKNIQPLLVQSTTCTTTNHTLVEELLNYCIPVTSAFVGVQRDLTIHTNTTSSHATDDVIITYDELLISRRSKFRSGTRFTRRGADGTGSVANYVETEQIIIIHGYNNSNREYIPSSKTSSSSRTHNCEQDECILREMYSHVQTRGSIPLRWSSPADIKTYRPRVLIGTDPLSQAKALRNHLWEQLQIYSLSRHDSNTFLRTSLYDNTSGVKLVFVNLIDKKSDQGRLGRAFDSVLSAVIDVHSDYVHKTCARYDDVPADTGPILSLSKVLSSQMIQHIWFDFHENVKQGKWSKLGTLLTQVSGILDQQHYFCATQQFDRVHAEPRWVLKSLQDGIIRTNCMDCLDRTNVVQSIFGRYILFRQLQEGLGKQQYSRTKNLPAGASAAFQRMNLKLPWAAGENAHRLLWADNADIISRLYAGTNALKGDYTRTGVRTKQGILDDGINSLQRYYLNNFQDAERQEAIDLIVGNADFAFTTADEENIFHQKDDTVYARIKISKASQIDLVPRVNLRLQWLPGDLQSQMRSCSLEGSPLMEKIVSQQLSDIDRRASLHEPWWVCNNKSRG